MCTTMKKMKFEDFYGPLNDVEKKYAPDMIYIAGRTDNFRDNPRISIVGTRNPSKQGIEQTENLVKVLSKHQISIVSGLARGIDTVAHKTAIEMNGFTIAVLGTPIDRAYPPENRVIQDFIMKEHLAISQFDPDFPIVKKNFPLRNRTMALISHATVIVEAGDSSGALSQGWESLRLGRPLFLLPSVISDKSLSWPNKMKNYGAMELIECKYDDILNLMPEKGSLDVAFIH